MAQVRVAEPVDTPAWAREMVGRLANASRPDVRFYAANPRERSSDITYTPGQPALISVFGALNRTETDLRRSLIHELAHDRLDRSHSSHADRPAFNEAVAAMEHQVSVDHSEPGLMGCQIDHASTVIRGTRVRYQVDGRELVAVVADTNDRGVALLDAETLREVARVGPIELSLLVSLGAKSGAGGATRRRVNKQECQAANGQHAWTVTREGPHRLSTSGRAEYYERDHVCRACGYAETGAKWSKTIRAKVVTGGV